MRQHLYIEVSRKRKRSRDDRACRNNSRPAAFLLSPEPLDQVEKPAIKQRA